MKYIDLFAFCPYPANQCICSRGCCLFKLLPRRVRQSLVTVASLLIMLILTSCWGRNEAQQLDYALAAGIDLTDQKEVVLTIQTTILESLKQNGGTQEIEHTKTISVKGRSTSEAVRKYSQMIGKKLFWSHLQIIIFGENAIKVGVEPYLSFFASDPRIRGTSHLAVVKGAAYDAIRLKPNFSGHPSYHLRDILKLGSFVGEYPVVNFSEFNRMLADPVGAEPYLPVIKLFPPGEFSESQVGKKPSEKYGTSLSSYFNASELAVLKKTKFVGYLNEAESRGLLWTKKDKLQSTVVTIPCRDIKMENNHCNVSTHVVDGIIVDKKINYSDGKTTINIHVRVNFNVGDESSKHNTTTEEYSRYLEEQFAAIVKKEITAAFDKAVLEYHSDIFAFGNALEDRHPKTWALVRNDWEERILPKAELTITVDAKLKQTSRNLYLPWSNSAK